MKSEEMFQVIQPSHPLKEDEPDSYDKVDATTICRDDSLL